MLRSRQKKKIRKFATLKRELHELPYKEIVKSGTIILAFGLYFTSNQRLASTLQCAYLLCDVLLVTEQ